MLSTFIINYALNTSHAHRLLWLSHLIKDFIFLTRFFFFLKKCVKCLDLVSKLIHIGRKAEIEGAWISQLIKCYLLFKNICPNICHIIIPLQTKLMQPKILFSKVKRALGYKSMSYRSNEKECSKRWEF